MRYLFKVILLTTVFILSFGSVYASGHIPTGVPIDLNDILDVSENIGGFLMVFGGVLGAIAIVLAGIMYLMAGSDPSKVKGAKDLLKAAIIGSLILFSVGIIINTIRGLATDPLQFFN